MKGLDRFYNEIFSKLPFSITGYTDIESRINSFFDDLLENSICRENANLEFLSYAYAKLNKIDSWQVISFSESFFFHALNEKYSDIILSFYYYAGKKLFSKEEDGRPLTANILAGLFIRDCSFRLKYSLKPNWSFSYLQSRNAFSVEIPLSQIFKTEKDKDVNKLFRSMLGTFHEEIIDSMASDDEQRECLLVKKHSTRNSNLYKKTELTLSTYEETPCGIIHKKLFDSLYKDENDRNCLIKELTKAINYFHDSNPGFFNPDDTKNLIEEWVRSFLSICFVSYFYDCWVEYMPAVCGLFSASHEYRNLGGLIVGYKIDNEITLDERAAFKMVSEKISSAIAADIMHQYLPIDIVRQASQCFGIEGVAEITHGGGGRFKTEDALQRAKVQCETFIDEIKRYQNKVSSLDYLNGYLKKVECFNNYLTKVKCYDGVGQSKLSNFRTKEIQLKGKDILSSISANLEIQKTITVQGAEIEFHINPIMLMKDELVRMLSKIRKHSGIQKQDKIYATLVTNNIGKTGTSEKYPLKEYENYIIFFHDLTTIPDNITEWDWLGEDGVEKKVRYLGKFYCFFKVNDEIKCYDSKRKEKGADIHSFIIAKEKYMDCEEAKNLFTGNHAMYVLKTITYKQ